jgi:hypothetical protein
MTLDLRRCANCDHDGAAHARAIGEKTDTLRHCRAVVHVYDLEGLLRYTYPCPCSWWVDPIEEVVP